MSALHIMVVEDDRDIREYMGDLLSLYGYQVTSWRTSVGAIEHIDRQQPDLIVLDHWLDLPPNGWEVLQQLRAQTTTARIPVILYSAERDFLESHRDELRSMGGDILHKPFSPDQLLAKIEALTLLSNER